MSIVSFCCRLLLGSLLDALHSHAFLYILFAHWLEYICLIKFLDLLFFLFLLLSHFD